MKKSTWFALIALILIVLILQSFGSRIKIYEKTKEYISQEEVIKDYLKNVNLMWGERNSKGEIVKTIPNLDFYETISERYRLLEEKNSGFVYNSVPYFKEYTVENVSGSNSNILEKHLKSYGKIKGYKVPKKREIYKISGYASREMKYKSDDIDENGDVEDYSNGEYEYIYIYLAVVDEGNGYVVDDYIEEFDYYNE